MLASTLLFLALASTTSSALPHGVPLSEAAVLRLVIPDYEKKLQYLADPACRSDFQCIYTANIVSARRTNLGVAGKDLLVALIHEVSYECTGCHHAILAVIDLPKKSLLFIHDEEGAFPDTLRLRKGSSVPWPMSITFAVSGNHMDPGARLDVTSRLTKDGSFQFAVGPVVLEVPR